MAKRVTPLRWERLRRGLTLAEVAARLQISTTYLAAVERGQQTVDLLLADKLAQLYDRPREELFPVVNTRMATSGSV